MKKKDDKEKIAEIYSIISSLKNKIETIENNCPFPIRAIYTQYPNCIQPSDLWKKTKWEFLDFKGVFFRSIGEDSNILVKDKMKDY